MIPPMRCMGRGGISGRIAGGLLGACLLVARAAMAEPPPPRDWELAVFPYVWAAGIEAEVDTRAGDVVVDQDFLDILEDLELGAMGVVQARWRRFVFEFDGVYTKVGDETDVRQGLVRADVDLTQMILDAKLGFRVLDATAPWGDASAIDTPRVLLDVLAGVRYWYNGFDVDLESRSGADRKIGPSRDWVDPIVGLRAGLGLTRTISVSVMGDVGGFDVGNASEWTWMVMPSLNWRPWDRVSFHAGYKHLDVDRERPSTNQGFGYTMSGPFLGVGFHF
jgi:hypothetical protein